MDISDNHIIQFWASLQNCGVSYILVGEYAMTFHGWVSHTGRIEIWIRESSDNRQRLRQAFIECGMEDHGVLETMQFVPGRTDFQLLNGLSLGILVDMKGLEGYSFEECLDMASTAGIDNVRIPFLQINQ